MSVKMRNLTLFSSAFAALLLFAAFFSACESTLGFGTPIDWEPPELKFKPIPSSPMYVRQGAELTGTVSDNVGVTRVIVRNANTGKEMKLFQVTLSGSDPKSRTWKIVMNFTEADNNQRIPLEVVAYDKAGNSGEKSMIAVTIIVDIGPPIVEDMWIQRTDIRTADMESYSALYELEKGPPTIAAPNGGPGSDPKGEISANANRYQNGFFTIVGKVAEIETNIEIIALNIYDVNLDPNTPLVELSGDMDDPNFSAFSPRWLVSEEKLLDEGEKIQTGYKDGYYNLNKRYYYRVEIVAIDHSKNESNDDGNIMKEDEGYFVMWENADIPKGVVDPLLQLGDPTISIQKGASLPVVFFDDDQLDWAYAGLLTKEQWNGDSAPAGDLNPDHLKIPSSKTTDQEKLEWLRDELKAGTTINNWKQSRYAGGTQEQIKEQIGVKSLDEDTVYIQTGNSSTDNGEYRLFTLVADKKLDPHTGDGPKDTNRTRERLRVYTVNVIDENEPLIVFDTVDTSGGEYDATKHLGSSVNEPIKGAQTGDSPEENTFPRLEGGERFTLNGYTLRENKPGQNNRVESFRMAWIPMGMIAGSSKTESEIIKEVQDALKDLGYPVSMNDLREAGVVDWNFTLNDPATPHANTQDYDEGTLFTGTNQELEDRTDGSFYKKQVFKHEFNILEDFKYDDDLENLTKLFVFYAEDDMGHVVFRNLRLLGKKTPPDLVIYDISGKINDTAMPNGLPNIGVSPYLGNAENGAYVDALKTYNQTPAVYTLLRGRSASLTDADKTIPFQIYTRDTILKYWVTANKSGDLNIKSITMQDITVEPESGQPPREVGSVYNATDGALTYVEFFPDEAQRVFLFTATDTLNNQVQIQRTIAITNTARLNDITTTSGNGTYGIGKEIILQANFSAQVRVTGTPQLNVRYQFNGNEATDLVGRTYTRVGNYIYESINCETVSGSTLALQFIFKVPTGALYNNAPAYRLLTMYDGDSLGGDANETIATDRPIRLLGGARIIDVIRDVDAFVPGYMTGSASMPKWTTDKGSLQASKNIYLDGARPLITAVSVSGKTAYTTNQFYFKTDETILLTLSTASTGKNIRASSPTTPRLQYFIDPLDGGAPQGPFTAAFTYLRPSGSRALVFGLEVNGDNCPVDGELVNVSLLTGTGAIEDDVGNSAIFNGTGASNLLTLAPSGTRIYIKKTITNPASTLGGGALSDASATWNTNPQLVIPVSAHTNTTIRGWEDVRQYSLNGGLEWVNYTAAVTITNGTWDIRTRYVDRAGNESPTTAKPIEVNNAFPRLQGVSAVEANATYNRGSTLHFTLNFADTVSIFAGGTDASLSITLADTTTTINNGDGTNPSYSITLDRTNAALTGNNKAITFTWTSVNGKDMLNGLRITALNLSGLRDGFGNTGPSTFTLNSTRVRITAQAGVPTQYDVDYNLAGIIVSGIAPRATSYTPLNAAPLGNDKTAAVSADNKTITIVFNKPMQRGRGTITIRPHGNYAIPAVFENEGYYLTVNLTTGAETRSSTKPTTGDSTYVSGMNDVYNNMTIAQRNYLITGGTLAAPNLSPNTGLSVGPYKKMTHGLKQGAGYTGNYNNNYPAAPNAPGTTGTTYMVPDTTTKWVLDYQYQIHDTAAGAVSNIRAALTSIGFRKQEIAVTSTANVAIPSGSSTVTITLSEPLLPGLQWDLSYPEGTFTDLAGNSAAGVTAASHWFWSRGVQKPVIRVDRKSYDGRAAATVNSNGQSSFIHDGTNTDQTYTANGYAGAITDFNTVAYRIETETPGARIFYGTQDGSAYATGGSGSITGAWTGRATLNSGTNLNTSTTLYWDGSSGTNTMANKKTNANQTIGEWVRTNLIFRNQNGDSNANPPTQSYTVTENGITVTQTVGGNVNGAGDFGNNYYGFRSFNRDATATELSGLPLATSGADNMFAGSFTGYGALQASKNYVAADARIDHVNATFTTATYTSQKGYEGVFRTVMALNQAAATGGINNYILMCGTNVKSGIPTVAGFPVKDGVANTDTRFLKVFYINNTTQYYWVSTEIVTPWYMQNYGRGNGRPGSDQNSYGRMGDATDWVTAGYGDLSYTFNMYTW